MYLAMDLRCCPACGDRVYLTADEEMCPYCAPLNRPSVLSGPGFLEELFDRSSAWTPIPANVIDALPYLAARRRAASDERFGPDRLFFALLLALNALLLAGYLASRHFG